VGVFHPVCRSILASQIDPILQSIGDDEPAQDKSRAVCESVRADYLQAAVKTGSSCHPYGLNCILEAAPRSQNANAQQPNPKVPVQPVFLPVKSINIANIDAASHYMDW